MLTVPGVSRDTSQLGGDPVVIEDLPLGTSCGIDQIKELASRRFPFVPEPLGTLDPARGDPRAVDQIAHAVGGEPGRELEVG